jgi:predicted  nucleic acid-binding Zn-ribbon protein
VLSTNVKLVDEAEDITNNVVNSLDDLRGRILANPETMIAGNTNRARKFSDLLKQIEYTKKDARNISARMTNSTELIQEIVMMSFHNLHIKK